MDILNTSSDSERNTPKIYYDDFRIDDKWLDAYKLYYLIVDSVFMLPTIFGNFLVLLAIWRFHELRKNTSCILIANLVISDFLVGIIVFPFDLITLVENRLNRSLAFCLWHHCLIYTLIVASVLNLFILSLERFHAITQPLKHASVFTKHRVYKLCGLIWLLVCVFGFSPVLGWHHDVDHETFVCRGSHLMYQVYIRVMCSLAAGSLFINSVFFIIIVRIVFKTISVMKMKGTCPQNLKQQRIKRDIRHTRMMLMVSGLFILLWGPFCILTLVPRPSSTLKFVTSWTSSLGLINSSTNWIVYGLRSKKFKAAFKAILTCDVYQKSRSFDASTMSSTGFS